MSYYSQGSSNIEEEKPSKESLIIPAFTPPQPNDQVNVIKKHKRIINQNQEQQQPQQVQLQHIYFKQPTSKNFFETITSKSTVPHGDKEISKNIQLDVVDLLVGVFDEQNRSDMTIRLNEPVIGSEAPAKEEESGISNDDDGVRKTRPKRKCNDATTKKHLFLPEEELEENISVRGKNPKQKLRDTQYKCKIIPTFTPPQPNDQVNVIKEHHPKINQNQENQQPQQVQLNSTDQNSEKEIDERIRPDVVKPVVEELNEHNRSNMTVQLHEPVINSEETASAAEPGIGSDGDDGRKRRPKRKCTNATTKKRPFLPEEELEEIITVCGKNSGQNKHRDKKYRCKLCNQSVSLNSTFSQYNLLRHVIKEHSDNKPFKCWACGFAGFKNAAKSHARKSGHKPQDITTDEMRDEWNQTSRECFPNYFHTKERGPQPKPVVALEVVPNVEVDVSQVTIKAPPGMLQNFRVELAVSIKLLPR